MELLAAFKTGGRNYWLIDLETRAMKGYVLEKGQDIRPTDYIFTVYDHGAVMEAILPGLRIDCTGIGSLP